MKKTIILCLLLLCRVIVSAQTFITNVTLIDVEHQKLISAATVGITGNTVTSIATKSKNVVPKDATVIDGSGKFLLPGMTDAHVHFFQSGGLYTRPDAIDFRKYQPYDKEIQWTHDNLEDFLRRYVQNGITAVIDLGATFNFLQQRDTFQTKPYAPHIFMTGPLLTSDEPTVFQGLKKDEPFTLVATPNEGVKGVDEQLPYHPDFIKIWYIVNDINKDSLEASAKRFQPVVKAIIDEAHQHHLKVAVHATQRITAKYAVESGCDYLVHGIEDEIVGDDSIRLLKAKNVIDCPTLIVEDGYYKTFGQTEDYSLYDLTQSNPLQIGSIEDLKHLPDTAIINYYKKVMRSPKFVAKWQHDDSVRRANLKKMADGGIAIAAGTDAGNIGTQHATSFYDELLAMKQSGLGNWQIVESATINPAKILNRQDSLGSIAIGKQADLVLLNANPIDSIENITKINLVINKGVVINPDTLVKPTPEMLVQEQVNGFNAGNIDVFLEPYSDSAELYYFRDNRYFPDGNLMCKGKDTMRQVYGGMLKKYPNLHCEIVGHIIQGNFIINKESITGWSSSPVTETVVYYIENNKIRKVYFID